MWLCILLVVAVFSPSYEYEDRETCDETLMWNILNATTSIMDYMYQNRDELIFDAALSFRMLADQAKLMLLKSAAVLKSPRKVREQLRRIMETAEKAITHVMMKSRGIDEDSGSTEKGAFSFWYDSRPIQPHLLQKPNDAAEADADFSEECLEKAHPPRWKAGLYCNFSQECWKYITLPGFDEYDLTHQLLDFQLAEAYGCFSEKPYIFRSAELNLMQNTYCTNIYRDAKDIAKKNFPYPYLDLFTEQIVYCGMYGFKEFFKRKWVEVILSHKQRNGCYLYTDFPEKEDRIAMEEAKKHKEKNASKANDEKNHRRVKRDDAILHGNCSQHATSLAAAALVMELRFCLEYLSNMN